MTDTRITAHMRTAGYAAPSDVVFRLVKLPVIVLRRGGVSPDAPVAGQASL